VKSFFQALYRLSCNFILMLSMIFTGLLFVAGFLFTCYKFDPLRVEEILALCEAEQIDVVTVSYGSWEAETVNLFLERGILLFEHTVNLPEMVQLSLEKGIYGFYTDFLQNLNEMP